LHGVEVNDTQVTGRADSQLRPQEVELVGGYGWAMQGDEIYARHSLGLNVNLWSGMVMLLFGAAMLLLARRGRAAARSASKTVNSERS